MLKLSQIAHTKRCTDLWSVHQSVGKVCLLNELVYINEKNIHQHIFMLSLKGKKKMYFMNLVNYYFTSMEDIRELSKLSNIGKVVEEQLIQVGIII